MRRIVTFLTVATAILLSGLTASASADATAAWRPNKSVYYAAKKMCAVVTPFSMAGSKAKYIRVNWAEPTPSGGWNSGVDMARQSPNWGGRYYDKRTTAIYRLGKEKLRRWQGDSATTMTRAPKAAVKSSKCGAWLPTPRR